MNRSEFWTRAFASIRTHRMTSNRDAARLADEALVEFDTRFRGADRATTTPSGPPEFDLERALDLFVSDPADSDYQRGWLACLLSILPNDDHPQIEQLKAQLTTPASINRPPLGDSDLQMLYDGIELLQPDNDQGRDLRHSLMVMLERAIAGQRTLTPQSYRRDYSEGEVETAMCMWEWVLDHVSVQPIAANLEGNGYSAVRMAILELAPKCWADFCASPDYGNVSLDWDYVPEWMGQNVNWDDLPACRSGSAPLMRVEPFWPVLVSTFASNVMPPAISLCGLNSNDWDDFVVGLAKECDRRRRTATGDFYAGAFMEQAAARFNENPNSTKEQLLAAGQAESDAIAN